MKRVLVLMSILLLAMAVPAFGQSRSVDLIGFVNWVDPNGDGVIEGGSSFNDVDVNFEAEQGFGVAVNVFWSNRFSTEFAASVVEPDVAFRSSNPAIPAFTAGSLEMIPITVTLQYHFAPDARLDPYIGAGAAYVLFDEFDSSGDVDNVNLDALDFDDDVGLVLNAGLSFDITDRFAVYADAKYVPVKTSATARFATGPGTSSDIDVNPLIFSVGLGFQF